MSVSFSVPGMSTIEELNLSNANARELLELLGFAPGPDLTGELPAAELAARARRILWPERAARLERASEREPHVDRAPGRCLLIECGRRSDYFADRCTRLLALAEDALEHRGAEATIAYS